MNDVNKGLLYGFLSAVSFALMAVLASYYKVIVTKESLLFGRGTLGVIVLFPFCFKRIFKLNKYVWLRSLFGSLGIMAYYYNLQKGFASEAKLLTNFNPLFVAIISYIYYKERQSRNKLIGLSIILTGLSILVFEKIHFGSIEMVISGLLGGLFAALAYVSLKNAVGKATPYEIVFGLSVSLVIVSSFFIKSTAFLGSTKYYSIILGISTLGVVGQLLLTKSYLYLDRLLASKLSTLTVVFIFIIELFFIKLAPSLTFVLSYLLVCLGILISFLASKSKRNEVFTMQKYKL